MPPVPTPTPKKTAQKAAPKTAPVKRGPTIPAPFHLASESRALIRQALHPEPSTPAKAPAAEVTPARPRRVQQIAAQPKLTIPVSPKLSTRTRAQIRNQVEASLRDELNLETTPEKGPEKVRSIFVSPMNAAYGTSDTSPANPTCHCAASPSHRTEAFQPQHHQPSRTSSNDHYQARGRQVEGFR